LVVSFEMCKNQSLQQTVNSWANLNMEMVFQTSSFCFPFYSETTMKL
jgi:hypothetical protein